MIVLERNEKNGPKGSWTLDLSIISRTLHQAELSAHYCAIDVQILCYLFVWVPSENKLDSFFNTDVNAFKCMLSDIFY